MFRVILIIQAIVAIILIMAIITQLPPEDNWQVTNLSAPTSKRGVEKFFFIITIFLLIVFVVLSLTQTLIQ